MAAFSVVGTLVALMVGESGSEAMRRGPQQQNKENINNKFNNKQIELGGNDYATSIQKQLVSHSVR